MALNQGAAANFFQGELNMAYNYLKLDKKVLDKLKELQTRQNWHLYFCYLIYSLNNCYIIQEAGHFKDIVKLKKTRISPCVFINHMT